MVLLRSGGSGAQRNGDIVDAVNGTDSILNLCGGGGRIVGTGVVPIQFSVLANIGQVHTQDRVVCFDNTGSGEHGIDMQCIVQKVRNIFIDFDFAVSRLNEVDHSFTPLQNSHEAIFQTVDNL
nr:MAG TPA: hypothetical protein [Caudoviricetes sp.]